MSRISTGGVSDAAEYIETYKRKEREHMFNTCSFEIKSGDELAEVYQECRSPNWDGYNAAPVDQCTMARAYAFLQSLPLGFPGPTIGAEPDGAITFEWYQSPRQTLSVSIDQDGVLHYAALVGVNRHHGRLAFIGDFPDILRSLVAKVTRR